jgi:hypothetical protein
MRGLRRSILQDHCKQSEDQSLEDKGAPYVKTRHIEPKETNDSLRNRLEQEREQAALFPNISAEAYGLRLEEE